MKYMEKEQIFQRIVKFLSKIDQMKDDVLQEISGRDLTNLQRDILTILDLSGKKNLSALSECMHMNMPNCSREVKKLVQYGYIQKEGSCLDKRVIELSLTDSGRDVVEGLMERMKEIYFRKAGEWDSHRTERVQAALEVLEKDLLFPEA
jgi:DNA-binding MarR family transcriptional regulator